MDTRTKATDAEAIETVVVIEVPDEPSFPVDGGETTNESRPFSKRLAEATAGAKSSMYSASLRAALMAS